VPTVTADAPLAYKPLIHLDTTSSASLSGSTVPSGGICDDGRRERIRTSIALASGIVGLIIRLTPSGWPGTCHDVLKLARLRATASPSSSRSACCNDGPLKVVSPLRLWQVPQFAAK